MAPLARVRIWGDARADHEDYITLERAFVLPGLSEPAQVLVDRLGRKHVVEPPGSAARQYVTELALTFPTRYADRLSTAGPLSTRRWLAEWVHFYASVVRPEVYVFAETTLVTRPAPGDAPEVAPHKQLKRAYRGQVLRTPPALLSLLNDVDGQLPRFVTLELVISDQGSYIDFDNLLAGVAWEGR
jgi:hypothetical protein